MAGVFNILLEGLTGGLVSVFKIALIVIPLMVIMEIAKDLHILDRITDMCSPITDILGISKTSAFPLAVGLAFGLAYGAGVIIQSAKQGNIDKRDLILMSVFLVCCHAVIEDSLVFVAVGVNGLWLLTIRTVTAFVLTVAVSRIIAVKHEENGSSESDNDTMQ